MAKRVRISDDGGTSWYTLPGNTAEISNEAGEIDDTVFGQDFSSSQTGLIGWTISANALYKGFAGYVAKILKPGSTTAFTTEATTQVGSTKTYFITDRTKSVWNRNMTLSVIDDGTPVAASNIQSIDFLHGYVTFIPGYTVDGAVTVTGNYFPMQVVGCSNAFTLTQTANAIDETCMDTASQNDGHRIFDYGLKTVSLDLTGIYKPANGFQALLAARTELVIEVNPDGASKAVARGWFKAMNTGQSGDVGDLEQETITFNLSVPDDDRIPFPFKWRFANDVTLNVSVQKCIESWEDSELIDICYLPDGSTGVQGEAVITDLTLSGGLEVMNEFTVNVQGSDELSAYP